MPTHLCPRELRLFNLCPSARLPDFTHAFFEIEYAVVPWAPQYRVTSFGCVEVKQIKRGWVKRKLVWDKHGTSRVSVSIGTSQGQKHISTYTVARLMWEAFVGHVPEGYVVARLDHQMEHKDEHNADRYCATLRGLMCVKKSEWARVIVKETGSEIQEPYIGPKTFHVKYSVRQVLRMIDWADANRSTPKRLPTVKMAEHFGISRSMASRVVNGRSRKDVQKALKNREYKRRSEDKKRAQIGH